MNTENLNLVSENMKLKEVVGKLESEKTDLKKTNAKMMDQIGELKEKIKSLEAEKLKGQESRDASNTNLIPMKRSNEEDFKNLEIKRAKLSTKCIPNWLLEVLAWICRIEMANSSLSNSCTTFQKLCWPKLHGKVKRQEMPGLLEFFGGRFKLGNVRAVMRADEEKYIPIASISPPEYIFLVDININLAFIDGQVLTFMEKIAHLLENCHFVYFTKDLNYDKNFVELTHNLLKCLKISQLNLYPISLNKFNVLYPGIIDQVQLISYSVLSNSDIEFLAEWLTKQRTDGKQKLLKMHCAKEFVVTLINRIKDEFLHSISSSTFVLRLDCYYLSDNEFTLENERTNEILTFYGKNLGGYHLDYYFARYPKEDENAKKEGESIIEDYKSHWPHDHSFFISIYSKKD